MSEIPTVQAPNPPAPPKEQQSNRTLNWEKITLVSSVVIFFLIVLIFAYWFFLLRPKIEPSVQDKPVQITEPNQNKNDDPKINEATKNWKTSKNIDLGIEFKYPPDWSVETNDKPSINFSTENQDDWDLTKYTEILVKSPDHSSAKTGIEGSEEIKGGSRILIIPYRNKLTFTSLDKVLTLEIGPRDFEKSVTVGGQESKRVDFTLNTAFYYTEIYVLKNGKVFLISRNYLESERSIYEDTFNTMLATFKFNN